MYTTIHVDVHPCFFFSPSNQFFSHTGHKERLSGLQQSLSSSSNKVSHLVPSSHDKCLAAFRHSHLWWVVDFSSWVTAFSFFFCAFLALCINNFSHLGSTGAFPVDQSELLLWWLIWSFFLFYFPRNLFRLLAHLKPHPDSRHLDCKILIGCFLFALPFLKQIRCGFTTVCIILGD